MKCNRFLRIFLLIILILSICIPIFASHALYNDAAYDKYINISENSNIPSIFRNDSVYENYKEFPPVISDGVEYVPLHLFEGLPDVKINYSNDKSNFYIQNKKKNRYISFSINGDYAVTGENKVFDTLVKEFYGVLYVPLRLVCSNTGIGCDSYNDAINRIYVIKVYTQDGLSASELIKIYAPDIYETKGAEDEPVIDPPPVVAPVYGNRELYLYFTGTDLTYADNILNVLSKNKLNGAFFVTYEDILARPELIRRIYALGNTIGITFRESPEEIIKEGVLEKLCAQAEDALYEVLKTKTRLLHLPGLNRQIYNDNNISERVQKLGLCDIRCNIDIRTDVLGHAASYESLDGSLKNLERIFGTQKAHLKLTYTYTSFTICDSIADLVKNHSSVKVLIPNEVSAISY